ncbi:kinesin family protein [Purpureocillium lilacinum]|uniref:Kinesin family protein n=1 Tax=Purpureocillium lilacinum TaxID=33203 RepID=A0A179HUH0_PURLI|nr:kinesin family protein [Purpureocillium lilacinum]OAQ79200.1 kinesin family protein [Purpureocillium lilacinum]OAQ93040.1 kinesin family protein [Purpureocillium lilacinum]
MSVRVVARIRPLLEKELDKDVIVRADGVEPGKPSTVVKIPNPKNEAEEFSFAFNGVYDQATSQEALFTAEVQPLLKSLFQGYDLTIFAYGVTGTGKTHTMRGGLKLADRGVIPRLLSGVFRRGKKIMKDTEGDTTVRVTLSYYEIYNDKVYDLLEPPEKRTPSGLPLRAEANGRTVVAGLSERACGDLKDFEKMYIEANNNRVTAATKLNAHSSRSHAILRVKLTQTTGTTVRESTASAIDLAGSEDNRRTDNDKERLVESAAINKSLFVLSQCIEAIGRGDKRIPYRESKMTRILSLGQNKGITVMILNLAPLRSYHLDTLSSLNVSTRAKRIEVREIENEVVFKQVPRTNSGSGTAIARQPLRPLANAHNAHNVHNGNIAAKAAAADSSKPVKAFSVYTDKAKPSAIARPAVAVSLVPRRSSQKRPSDHEVVPRPTKIAKPAAEESVTVSAAQIEAMVEKKVSEILAARTAAEKASAAPPPPVQPDLSEAVQRRLDALERRIESEDWREDSKSDGLRYLLAARQHKERGEEAAALKAYEMALPYFPGQAKLLGKIERLRIRLGMSSASTIDHRSPANSAKKRQRRRIVTDDDREYNDADADGEEGRLSSPAKSKPRKSRAPSRPTMYINDEYSGPPSPRTSQLLDVVNSRDLTRIRGLVGFGAKRARDLVDYLELAAMEDEAGARIENLTQLRALPGMGGRTVERAYEGLMMA